MIAMFNHFVRKIMLLLALASAMMTSAFADPLTELLQRLEAMMRAQALAAYGNPDTLPVVDRNLGMALVYYIAHDWREPAAESSEYRGASVTIGYGGASSELRPYERRQFLTNLMLNRRQPLDVRVAAGRAIATLLIEEIAFLRSDEVPQSRLSQQAQSQVEALRRMHATTPDSVASTMLLPLMERTTTILTTLETLPREALFDAIQALRHYLRQPGIATLVGVAGIDAATLDSDIRRVYDARYSSLPISAEGNRVDPNIERMVDAAVRLLILTAPTFEAARADTAATETFAPARFPEAENLSLGDLIIPANQSDQARQIAWEVITELVMSNSGDGYDSQGRQLRMRVIEQLLEFYPPPSRASSTEQVAHLVNAMQAALNEMRTNITDAPFLSGIEQRLQKLWREYLDHIEKTASGRYPADNRKETQRHFGRRTAILQGLAKGESPFAQHAFGLGYCAGDLARVITWVTTANSENATKLGYEISLDKLAALPVVAPRKVLNERLAASVKVLAAYLQVASRTGATTDPAQQAAIDAAKRALANALASPQGLQYLNEVGFSALPTIEAPKVEIPAAIKRRLGATEAARRQAAGAREYVATARVAWLEEQLRAPKAATTLADVDISPTSALTALRSAVTMIPDVELRRTLTGEFRTVSLPLLRR